MTMAANATCERLRGATVVATISTSVRDVTSDPQDKTNPRSNLVDLGFASVGEGRNGNSSATRIREELSVRAWQLRRERAELVFLRRIESGTVRGFLVHKRRERVYGLADIRPAKSPFVAVVVGRVDALLESLGAGDELD